MDTSSGIEPRRVVVGVATFRRADELARLLPALLEQVHDLAPHRARVVVVDNDPDRSADAVLRAHADEHLLAVHEPTPGIAAARNRAIAEAGDADAVVFIDDDEIPDVGWLRALVDAWVAWGCAGVTGPVTSVFDEEPDPWVVDSGLFATQVRTTGSVNPGASSANLLLDLGVLRATGLGFAEAFGLSGGSDTMLAHSLRDAGHQIRWCQAAGVTEHVPVARSRRAWVLQRTVRTSNTWARVGLALAPPRRRPAVRAEMAARGGVRIARGAAQRVAAGFGRDRARDARGAVELASGRGLVLGALGGVRYEYQRAPRP